MGEMVEIAAWRSRGADGSASIGHRAKSAVEWHPSFGRASNGGDAGHLIEPGPGTVARLERAVGRLDRLTQHAVRTRGALAPDVETELFALIGQVQMGLVSEAADRAEHLVARLGGQRARVT